MSDISLLEDSNSESNSWASSPYSSEVEDLEQEDQASAADGPRARNDVGGVEPYADEPMANAEWVQNYQEEQRQENELMERLTRRLNGDLSLDAWCSCGQCQLHLLANAKECMCCTEIPECKEALQDKWVLEDVGDETPLLCITEHPGFKVVCLERWSLKLAADKYKTLQNRKYTQTGAEERFLRAVAYREFTRLVHGRLGNRRLPLPACAYNSIRKKFALQNERLRGFEEE